MAKHAGAAAIAAALFFSVAILTGCANSPLLASRAELAEGVAARHGWQRTSLYGGRFTLVGYRPAAFEAGYPLRVYIEGDGLAWLTRTQLSPDPTPSTPLVLQLAIDDPAPNTVYVARPCQYVTASERKGCSPQYWSVGRYAPEVVTAINLAIDSLKTAAGATDVELVGYSGGGTVAVLAAADRNDVTRIVSMSANLDHARWTGDAGDAPLTDSRNAADYAERVAHIPQVHFIALDDTRVPAGVIESYLERVPAGAPVEAVRLRGYDHDCCWLSRWPALLREYVDSSQTQINGLPHSGLNGGSPTLRPAD